MTKRIRMIVTSHSTMGETGKPTGIWASELAGPYYMFRDAGLQVTTIASPAGGKVPFDPASLKPAGLNDASVERFLHDPVAQAQADTTLVAAEVNAAGYDAVFFPGGHGAMWDLPSDGGVIRAVAAAYAAGKVIAAVCHGPAGLLGARRPDGKSILADKTVNGFTDEEEAAAGLAGVVPFLLESRMRELGGRFEKAPNWTPFAVRDGQLITGQNPQSSELVAQHVLEAVAPVQGGAERAA
jgi:putative intracellular protease/amidase